MVPPGIPGRSDEDFLPDSRPRRGAPAPGRRRLSRRRGIPRDDDHDLRRRHRRGGRRGDRAGARHQAELRDDERRLLRPAGRGSAADLVDGLGRRLSRARTTSSASFSGPARRTTTAGGARPSSTRRSRTRSRRPIPRRSERRSTGPKRSSATRRRSSRSRTRPTGRSSRDGLLGAYENGLGIIRMAGLAWEDQ